MCQFMYFVSLSASENTLPSMDTAAAADQRKNRIGNRLLAFFNVILQKRADLLPMRASSASKQLLRKKKKKKKDL